MRKPALLATLAIAALAMTATTATAATQVKNKFNQPCPAVVPAIDKQNPPVLYDGIGAPSQGNYPGTYQSGGCTVHMTGQADPYMVMNNPWSAEDCLVDYDIHVGPDGWGYADNFNLAYCSVDEARWYTPPGTSRIVMPKGVNPNGWYTAADANTDLNVELYARWYPPTETPGVGSYTPHHGFASLNVASTAPFTNNTITIDNQLLDNDLWGGSFENGHWQGNAGLVITHN